MPKAAVVGPRGFIGASVVEELESRGYDIALFERSSAMTSAPHCQLGFFCAGSSAAYLSLKDPARCLQANVIDLHSYLAGLKVDRWVLMSSLSVYPADSPVKSEDSPIDLSRLSMYGAHKALAEAYARAFARDALILRVGYLYGKGLRKNLLFDLRSGRSDLFLTPSSILAPLDVALLANAAVSLAEKAPAGTYNVASRYVVTASEVAALKGGAHEFRGERHVDERGVTLQRLGAYWIQTQTEAEHRASIRSYVGGH
jgi:nucleoside-diphosphate-sugar epimerase